MRKRIVALVVACTAVLVLAVSASAKTVVHPVTGECRQILTPGPDTFPGNWDAVSSTPAAFPGPWNGHGNANANSALGPVVCP